MRYYSNRIGSKRNGTAIKILSLVACCIAVFALTVIYGNYLLKKAAESAKIGEGGHIEPITSTATSDAISPRYAPRLDVSPESKRHSSAYFDVSAYETDEELRLALDLISSSGYDAITVNIRLSDGSLIYASSALAESFGIKYDPSLPTEDSLASAFTYAKAIGLTVSTVFSSSKALEDARMIPYDKLLVAELAHAGADEIILTDIFDVAIDSGKESFTNAEKYLLYLTQLRSSAPAVLFGAVFFDAPFRSAAFAPQLEELYKHTDIMLVDIRPLIASSDNDAAAVAEFHSSLSGSITHYNLRAITDPIAENEELITALRDNAILNRTEFYTSAENQPVR